MRIIQGISHILLSCTGDSTGCSPHRRPEPLAVRVERERNVDLHHHHTSQQSLSTSLLGQKAFLDVTSGETKLVPVQLVLSRQRSIPARSPGSAERGGLTSLESWRSESSSRGLAAQS